MEQCSEWQLSFFCESISISRISAFFLQYAASYPEDVLCLVAIDALIREQIAAELFWKSIGSRIDKKLEDLSSAQKTYKDELTLEKAIEV